MVDLSCNTLNLATWQPFIIIYDLLLTEVAFI